MQDNHACGKAQIFVGKQLVSRQEAGSHADMLQPGGQGLIDRQIYIQLADMLQPGGQGLRS
jgi:hypothetical protein